MQEFGQSRGKDEQLSGHNRLGPEQVARRDLSKCPRSHARSTSIRSWKSFDARRVPRPQFMDKVCETFGCVAATAVCRRFISEAAVRSSFSS